MDTDELRDLISRSLQDFYRRRSLKLQDLRLSQFLRKKNPYLFRAFATEKASEIVERLLVAFIGASDETIFGDAFFEPIARVVSRGRVSDAEGVDFTVESDQRIMAVAVKSGPNIYNASQSKRQNTEFLAVRSRLYKMQKQFDPVLAHGYGRLNRDPSGARVYRDSSGQRFWTEITGDPDFYLKLIRLMEDEPAKHKEEYSVAWDAAVNRFTLEFSELFCFPDGRIDWEKLVGFVSEDITTAEATKKYMPSRSRARGQKAP
jgi:hypothetical protein